MKFTTVPGKIGRDSEGSMKLVIGADGAGKPLLDVIAKHLATKGVAVPDMSPPSGSRPSRRGW